LYAQALACLDALSRRWADLSYQRCGGTLFAGSDRGGERAAVMYTLIATARMNDIDPQAWLADVLARINDHKITDLFPAGRGPVLLPILYLKGISTGDFEDALVALLGKDARRALGLDHRQAQASLVGGAHALEQA